MSLLHQPTPGEWHASFDAVPDGHVQVTVYAESSGERVATVFDRVANVPLIVAAPKLLDACRAALDYIGAHTSGDVQSVLRDAIFTATEGIER